MIIKNCINIRPESIIKFGDNFLAPSTEAYFDQPSSLSHKMNTQENDNIINNITRRIVAVSLHKENDSVTNHKKEFRIAGHLRLGKMLNLVKG